MVSKEAYEDALAAKRGAERRGKPVPEWVLSDIEEYELQVRQGITTPIYTTLLTESKYEVTAEQRACVEETIEELLSEEENATDPGLLLGKIQCGKTQTFERIIALAFDKGFDIAIVLTKSAEALVTQTVSRLQGDFHTFWESNHPDSNPIVIEDIMRSRGGFDQGRVDQSKAIIVAKKQADNMEYLKNIFSGAKNEWMRKKKVLIVDDEADFASRNYRGVLRDVKRDLKGNLEAQNKATRLAVISQKIDELRQLPDYCRYLQVTATPYSLFLQPDGKIALEDGEAMAFRPRFTKLVPIHPGYVGGYEYFELSQDPGSMFSHLYHKVEQKTIDVLRKRDKRYEASGISSGNLEGLTYSLMAYFIATAIRSIQQRHSDKPNVEYMSSAVYHIDTTNKKQEWQETLMKRMVEQIKEYFTKKATDDPRLDFIVKQIYHDFEESSRKARTTGKQDEQGNTIITLQAELPSQKEVIAEVRNLFEDNKCTVKVVNNENDVTSMLDPVNGQLRLNRGANIFIGGNILDRGITINNMLCFFYGRDPKQQDTVLQHARFYGARSIEDMAVTRLYTSDSIYNVLRRMNSLDEQLRDWIYNDFSGQDPRMVFVGFDKKFKPCAASKVQPSKTMIIKPGGYFAPQGMQVENNRKVNSAVAKIDNLITSAPDYVADGFFQIDKSRAVEILKLIRSTYSYKDDYENKDREGDMRELEAALHYCASMAADKVLVLHRLNRNMSRIRENGAWVDMPADGRNDLTPAREVSENVPVLMLLRQNGLRRREQVGVDANGNPKNQNRGWLGAAFYWPLLLAQSKIEPVLFAADVKEQGNAVTYSLEQLLEGINPDEVLKLTYKYDLEDHFGPEGSEYPDVSKAPVENRPVRDTTASKFFERTIDGSEYDIKQGVTIDAMDWADVYSYNNNRFPFMLKPYKYLLLYQGHGATIKAVLLELHNPEDWTVFNHREVSEDGYLVDYVDSNVKLIAAKDTIIRPDRSRTKIQSKNVCQWVIGYRVKRVVRYLNEQIAENV